MSHCGGGSSLCMPQGAVNKKRRRVEQACSGCYVGIPEPNGGRFADRPLQGTVPAVAIEAEDVVGSAFRSGCLELGVVAAFYTGPNHGKVVFIH